MCKKPCKECPWVNNNRHSLNFRRYVSKMKTIGVEKHACHMTTSDIWGYNTPISSRNICRGLTKINK
jgi:hypothetical protein